MTNEEVAKFVDSIKIEKEWNGKKKAGRLVCMSGLRLRTLTEVLLGTGMRISEALSLDRNDINWESREAMVVGKGDKQRTVFFSKRAEHWLKEYLKSRNDDNPALFVALGDNRRWARFDIAEQFRGYARRAGLAKRVTPHLLRHSMATVMLSNGCDIRYIQEMLGHADIQTTARYYLGTDKKAVKAAHEKYLILE